MEYLEQRGFIDTSLIDTSDKTYIAWKTDETISLSEYLHYAISSGWVDVSKFDLQSQYADTDEIYNYLLDSIFTILDNTTDFQKKFFKYMLKSDVINGKNVCYLLCEQGRVEIDEEDENRLYHNAISAA